MKFSSSIAAKDESSYNVSFIRIVVGLLNNKIGVIHFDVRFNDRGGLRSQHVPSPTNLIGYSYRELN